MMERNKDCLERRRQCPCGNPLCLVIEELGEYESSMESNVQWDRNHKQGGVPEASSKVIASVLAPFVGQSFQSDEEAQRHYSDFAHENGFAIRRERSKGNPEHPLGVYKRELVCHRAGPPLAKKCVEEKRQRKKRSARCQCNAEMVIKKDVSTGVARWVVVKFSNTHNHDLLNGNEMHQLPSFRYIPASDREHILVLAKAGCSIGLIMKTIEMEKGVQPGDLAFTERDLRNFLQASKFVDRDIEGSELLKSCKIMKGRNPDFRYEFTLDESNKLEHISWTYAESVRAFQAFGDVLIFDTMYRLYAYDKIVGVWFGMDSRGHAIFFGCVLLQDDLLHSLRWALQSFVRLMDGKFPRTILTDLDVGLKDAASSELPNIKHAFSIWHVLYRLSSWFSSLLGPQYDNFKLEFQRIYELEEVEQFGQEWNQLVSKFQLNLDRHINFLSFHRSHWALPYLRGWFFGTLASASHSIQIKPFFEGFLDSQTRLKDFVEQVGIAVDFQNQAGEEATTQENNKIIKIKTCMPIEEHASSILTHYAFELFQKEIVLSTQHAVFETSRECYLVRHHSSSDGGHLVSCNPSNEEVHCSCKGFETTGILCRHALRVLSLKNCFSLPEGYLLNRWRRESSLFPQSSGFKYRSQALRSLASIIVQEASITKERFDYIQWQLGKLLAHVRDLPTMEEGVTDLDPSSLFDVTFDVTPPKWSAIRGRPRKLKSQAETKHSEHSRESASTNGASSDFDPGSSSFTHSLNMALADPVTSEWPRLPDGDPNVANGP